MTSKSPRPVIAIDLKTRQKLYFGSIGDASTELGLNPANICTHLQNNSDGRVGNYLFLDENVFDTLSEKELDERIQRSINKISQRGHRQIRVRVVNKKTGKSIVFPTLQEASNYTDLSYQTLRRHVRVLDKVFENDDWQISREKTRVASYEVENKITGKTENFETLQNVARFVGVPYATLRYHLQKPEGLYLSKEWRILKVFSEF